MNETLKIELSKYFKKINGRKKFIENWFEKNKINEDITRDYEEEIENKLHLIAKQFMDKKGFDFENGRNRMGDRIRFADNRIQYIQWNCKTMCLVDFLGRYDRKRVDEFLPIGFIKVVEEININFEKIKNINKDFNGVIKTKIKVDTVDDYETKEEIVKYIVMKEDNIKINGSSYHKQYYYNDKVFRHILNLFVKYKKHKENVENGIKYLMKDINRILNGDYNKILVRERLLN